MVVVVDVEYINMDVAGIYGIVVCNGGHQEVYNQLQHGNH